MVLKKNQAKHHLLMKMHQYATFAMQKLSDVQNVFKSTDVTLCQNEIKKECQIAAFVTLVICVKNKETKITSIISFHSQNRILL